MARKRICCCCKKNEILARGLCNACYCIARRSISRGETTWTKLEKSGDAQPRQMTAMRKAIASSSR